MKGVKLICSKLGFGRILNFKRIILFCLLLTGIYLVNGFSLLFWTWPENLYNTIEPNTMIQPNNPHIIQLNEEFNQYLINSISYKNTSFSEFDHLARFIDTKIRYVDDLQNSFSINHFDSIDTIIQRGSDDCEGIAVVTCSILILRGYDAYVALNPTHAWINIQQNGQFYYCMYGGMAYWHARFNDKMVEFSFSSILLLIIILTFYALGVLVVANYIVVFSYNFLKLSNHQGKQWRINLNWWSKHPKLIITSESITKNTKMFFRNMIETFKLFLEFCYHNSVAILLTVVYFVISLAITLSILFDLGFAIGLWSNYSSGYLSRGIRLQEQGWFLLAGFALAIAWIAIYYLGVNLIWQHLGKNRAFSTEQ